MEIRWLEDALADVRDIYHYIAADNQGAAAATVRRIQEAATRLETLEERGRPGCVAGTRELVIAGTPFVIPYRIRGEAIEILRVLHGARQWPPAKGKG
jgi:toxin ParE1/3/4